MIQTIVIYTLLAFSMFYFTHKSNFNRGILSKVYYWVPVLLFTFVFGIRYGVGIDYFSYKDIYEGYDIGDILYVNGEWLFYLICEMGHKLHLSVPIYFSILSFLQVLFIYLAFKNRKLVLAYSILALFFTGIGISGFNNIIRQAVAFCIFVYALTLIERKKLLGYCMCMLLAFSFHLSAIILLPVYFLFNRGQNYIQSTKVQIIILLCCYSISWLNLSNLISPTIQYLSMYLDYDGYFNTHYVDARNRSIFDIVIFFMNLLLVFYFSKVKTFYNDRLFDIIYTLFWVSICLGYLLNDISIMWRILAYFSYLKFIIYGYYLYFFKNKLKYSYKNYVCGLLFVYYLLGFYCYSVLYRSYKSCSTYATYYQENLHKKQEKMNADYMGW